MTAAGALHSADLGGSSEYPNERKRLEAEAEKGSPGRANRRGLAGPEPRAKAQMYRGCARGVTGGSNLPSLDAHGAKGKQVNIPAPDLGG